VICIRNPPPLIFCMHLPALGSRCTAAGSEFNTPRSENNANFFRPNAQQTAATRGGHRRGVHCSFSVSFQYSQRSIVLLLRWCAHTEHAVPGGVPLQRTIWPQIELRGCEFACSTINRSHSQKHNTSITTRRFGVSSLGKSTVDIAFASPWSCQCDARLVRMRIARLHHPED
jgi:hypothetical protein